jgi:hypothetical protein
MIAKWVMPEVEVVFVDYNSHLHRNLVPEGGVVFADFSPHESQVEAWKPFKPTVLDHHAHAASLVTQFEYGVFNNDKCGAQLFWDWVQEHWSLDRPASLDADYFIRLIDIRDRWQRDSPLWDVAGKLKATLGKLGSDVALSMGVSDILEFTELAGDAILAGNRKSFEKTARDMTLHTLSSGDNKLVLAAGFAPLWHSSEVIDILPEADVACCVQPRQELGGDRVETSWIFSMRSRRIDIGAFCKSMGGGGHKSAAGFNRKVSMHDTHILNPLAFVEGELLDWAIKHVWASN